MTARLPRSPGPARLPRLTATGRVLLVAALLLIPAGTVAGYPELVMTGASAVAALGTGLGWTLTRSTVRVRRLLRPLRLAEGGSVRCVLVVSNPGPGRSRWVDLIEPSGPAIAVPALPVGAEYRSDPYELPFLRRGRYVLPPPPVGRSDPLGLFRAAPAAGPADTVLVHPLVRPLTVPGPVGTAGRLGSAARGTRTRLAASVDSLRPYLPGDDARFIHWMSTARLGEVMVREETIAPDQPEHRIVLDTAARRYPGSLFDEAVRVAASVAVALIRADVPVTLVTGDGRRAPGPTGAGTTHRRELVVLDFLASVERGGEGEGPAAGTTSAPTYPASLILVTGPRTPAELARIRRIARGWLGVTVVQLDPDASGPASTATGPLWIVRVRDSAGLAVLWRRR